MTGAGNLVVHLMAQTQHFEQGMRRGVSHTNTMRASVGKLGVSLAQGVAAFVGIGSAGMVLAGTLRKVTSTYQDLVRTGEEFNQAMTRSLSIMGDVTGMHGRLESAAVAAARVTNFSAKEAAGAYYFLASAGMDAEQSLAAMPQVAAFAQAGMFDLSTATDLATDAQSALGLSSKDATVNLSNMARVTDVLIGASKMENATALQFSEALTNKAGPALRNLNKSIEEGVSVLNVFAKQGLKGEEAGTALSIVLRDLQTRSIENRAAFDKQGISVFDASGKMRLMHDIIRDMERAFDGMSDEQRRATFMMLGFSDKSVAATQALLGTSDAMEAYYDQLQDVQGLTQEVAEKTMTDWQKATADVGASFDALGNSLSKNVIPAMGELVHLVARFVDGYAAANAIQRENLKQGKSLFNYFPVLPGISMANILDATSGGSGPSVNKPRVAAAPARVKQEESMEDFMERLYAEYLPEAPPLPPEWYEGLEFLSRMQEQPPIEIFAKGDLEYLQQVFDDVGKEFEEKTKLDEMGERLRAELETPLEAYQRRIDELGRMLDLGSIDNATYQRALEQMGGEIGGDTPELGPTRFAGAMGKDTREAYSAVLAAQSGRDDPSKKVAENTKDMKEQLKQIKDGIARQVALMEVLEMVEIPAA